MVLAFVVQVTILPIMLPYYFKPDLLLLFLVYISLHEDSENILFLAVFLGLIKDVTSGLYFGMNTLSYIMVYMAIKLFASKIYSQGYYAFITVVALSTFANLTVNLFLLLFTDVASSIYIFMKTILSQVLINTFLASLFIVMPKFNRSY